MYTVSDGTVLSRSSTVQRRTKYLLLYNMLVLSSLFPFNTVLFIQYKQSLWILLFREDNTYAKDIWVPFLYSKSITPYGTVINMSKVKLL